MESKCAFQRRSDWRVKPRTLWEETESSGLLSMVKTGKTGCSQKKHMRIILHLDGLRRMLWSTAHWWILSKSDCRQEDWPRRSESDRVISSTYFQRLQPNWVERPTSLIINKKRIGPNLVSWGTPAVIGSHDERMSLIFTACCRLDKKLHIQEIRAGRTPRWINFCTRIVW